LRIGKSQKLPEKIDLISITRKLENINRIFYQRLRTKTRWPFNCRWKPVVGKFLIGDLPSIDISTGNLQFQ